MKKARVRNSWSSQICKPLRRISLSCASVTASVKGMKESFLILLTHSFMLNDFITLSFCVAVASINVLTTYSRVYWLPSRIWMVDLSHLVTPLWRMFHMYETHLFIQQMLILWLLCAKHSARWIHAGKIIDYKHSSCFLIVGNLECSLYPQNLAEIFYK